MATDQGKTEEKPLTQLEKRFVLEYLIDFNGTRAYQKIYKVKKANVAAVSCSKLLRKVNVRKEIEAKADELLRDKTGLTLRARKEIESLAFSDLREYLDYDRDGNVKLKDRILNSTDIDTKPISAIEITSNLLPDGTTQQKIKLKLWDKNRAHDILGLHLSLAKRHELSGINGKPIEFNNIDALKQKILDRFMKLTEEEQKQEKDNNV
jgi:hypothetical protein